jgi:hypothetical protein
VVYIPNSPSLLPFAADDLVDNVLRSEHNTERRGRSILDMIIGWSILPSGVVHRPQASAGELAIGVVL